MIVLVFILQFIVFIILIVHKSNKNSICSICEQKILNSNDFSNAEFNNLPICKKCISKINKYTHGQSVSNITLEELRDMVNDPQDKTKKRGINNPKYTPYNAVPYELYKNAYINNKSKNYPNSYIVFDTETTGLDPSTDKIIEISAIKYINGEEADIFTQLINPNCKLDTFITDLTGITDNDLIGKPTIDIVLPKFFDFIEDYTLVAHNTQYDIKMIACECYRNNIEMCNNKLIDTITLAKRMIPKEEIMNYKLTTLKNYFGIKMRSHRATEDCQVCNVIYQNYLKFHKYKYSNKKIIIIDEDTGEVLDEIK